MNCDNLRSKIARAALGIAASLVLCVGVAASLEARSDATPTATSDEETLWQYELAIYAGRSRGDLSFYRNHADPDYTVWAPQMPAPIGYDQFAGGGQHPNGPPGEKITLEKKLIHVRRGGTLALVYYTTHRTRRASGAAVDESFENIHVWTKGPSGWRIIGGMSRPVPTHRENLDTHTMPVPGSKG